MKFKIKKNILTNALSFSSIPLLTGNAENLPETVKNIYVCCTDKQITFYGTNLKMIYKYSIKSDGENVIIEEPGNYLIYSKNLLNLIKKYSNDLYAEFKSGIDSSSSENELHYIDINIQKSSQRIFCKTKPNYDINTFGISNVINSINIPSHIYLKSIDKILATCGKNLDRYELFNICLEQINDKLYFVSSSGYSIATFNFTLENQESIKKALIRKDMVILDSKLYNLESDVSVIFGENTRNKKLISIQHTNKNEEFSITSTPIDLDFPKWDIFINAKESENKISVDKNSFIETLDRVNLISPNMFVLSSEEDKINIYSMSDESIKTNNCSFSEEVDHFENTLKGRFCLNTSFLKDGLKKINDDIIDFHLLQINNNNLFKINSPSNGNYNFFIGIMSENTSEEIENTSEEIEQE